MKFVHSHLPSSIFNSPFPYVLRVRQAPDISKNDCYYENERMERNLRKIDTTENVARRKGKSSENTQLKRTGLVIQARRWLAS